MGTELAAYFRDKARHCRHLADIAINRELRRLLDDLAREFEQKAAGVGGRDHVIADATSANAAAQAI